MMSVSERLARSLASLARSDEPLPRVGDVVGLVDDDDVPVGVLEVGAVLGVLLERVDGDDGLVVSSRTGCGWWGCGSGSAGCPPSRAG